MTTGTQTLEVNVRISIGGTLFSNQVEKVGVKSIDTTLTQDGADANGTIKLAATSSEPFEQIKEPSVSATGVVRINGAQIYRGRVSEVYETEDGEIEVKMISRRSKLSTKYSESQTPLQGEDASVLLNRVLVENGPFRSQNVKISIPSEYEVKGMEQSTSIENQDTVGDIIKQITEYQNAFTFVDNRDRLVISVNPCKQVWKPQKYISVSNGSQERTKKKVVVGTASAKQTSDEILNDFLASEQVQSEAKSGDGQQGKSERRTDNNVPDQKTAAKVALRQMVLDRTNANAGSVTIPGDPRIQPYDGIEVELPTDYTNLGGLFTAKSVQHKFNADNGYKTIVTLMPDLRQEYIDMQASSSRITDIAQNMYRSTTPINPSDVNNGLPRYP